MKSLKYFIVRINAALCAALLIFAYASCGSDKKSNGNTQSSNANLASLFVSGNGEWDANFSSTIMTYTIQVINSVTAVTVTPTSEIATATISVNETAIASGVTSALLPLIEGDNTIVITVTADDGTTTKSYTLKVQRLAPGVELLSVTTFASPAAGASNVSLNSFQFIIQFNRSMDTSTLGEIEFAYPPRIYKSGAAGLNTREIESAIHFSTTTLANDTVTITPSYVYGLQSYKNISVRGFKKSGGTSVCSINNPVYSFTTASITLSSEVTDWRNQIIYFLLTDRFNDGSPSNNTVISNPLSSHEDFIAGDGKKYQGGDFTGITAKMSYLKNLGINTIWITSPVKQAWENAGYTSYHGYWAQDFLTVDPHLGTMKDFREMVSAAHANGIAVIMDVVINHTGSLFNYPGASPNAWEPIFNAGGTYTIDWLEDTGIDEFIKANRKRPYFGEIDAATLQDFFTRKGGNATTGTGNEITQGDFAGNRDINTGNINVQTAMKNIFKWWIANTNIDGLRIDTVKHIDGAYWSDFCNEIRTWSASAAGGGKKFYMVAEVYDGSPAGLGGFTNSNKLDSVLGFNMADEVFDWNSGDNITVFKDSGSWNSRPKTIEFQNSLTALSADANLNANSIHTGGDGLSARQKIGYFLDNHDLNRFLNSTSGTSNAAPGAGEITNLRTALSWLLTWEGIPVIYYGTEQNYKQSLALTNHGEQGDGSGNCEKGNRPRLWMISNSSQGTVAWNESHDTFKLIKGLTALRTAYPALRVGSASIKWTDDGMGTPNDDGILAFIRKGASVNEDILIVINTNPNQYSAASAGLGNDLGTDWPAGTTLQVVPNPTFDDNAFSDATNNDTGFVDSDGTAAINQVAVVSTYAQAGKTSAVYFQLPPNTIRILKKQGYTP